MRKSTQKNPFEEKVRAMAEGFRAFPFPNTELVFRGESMLPAQAAARFQDMLDTYQSVRDAESAHRGAVDARDKAQADHQAFYEDAVIVVKSHFGSDPKRLATFGLGPVKRGAARGRSRQRETVVARLTEEVVERSDGSIEVRETEEILPGRERRREEEKPRVIAPGTPRVPPTAPATSPPPAATTPPAATPAPKAAPAPRKPKHRRSRASLPRAKPRGR